MNLIINSIGPAHLKIFAVAAAGSLINAYLHYRAKKMQFSSNMVKNLGFVLGILLDGLASGVISMFYFWSTPKDVALWQLFVFGAAAANIFGKGVTAASSARREKKGAHLGAFWDPLDPSLSFIEHLKFAIAYYYLPLRN